MTQYIEKSALVAEIEKRIKEHHSGYLVCLKDILSFLETLKVKYVEEEPASEDLEEEARRIATRHSHITGDIYYANDAWFFKKGAQWQKEHLWKLADGNDLPETDREVIVLYQPYPLENNEYAVSFAHRPSKNLLIDEIEHYIPETYDKGGWNIPDVKFWLDLELPIYRKGE